MLKKILSSVLVVSILTVASSVSVFAQAGIDEENEPNKQVAVKSSEEVQSEKIKTSSKDESKNAFLKSNANSNLNMNEKENLSSYEKSKAKGKGLSKGAKIAIIVGIAAGVVAAVAFAASRDKIRTF